LYKYNFFVRYASDYPILDAFHYYFKKKHPDLQTAHQKSHFELRIS